MVRGPKMVAYAHSDAYKSRPTPPSTVFEREQASAQAPSTTRIGKMDGAENPYQIWWELGQMMTTYVTVERHNNELKTVDEKIQKMMERWKQLLGARHRQDTPTRR